MLKLFRQFTIPFLVSALILGSITFASELQTFTAEEASFPIMIDGIIVELDMPIVTIQNHTYLPLRALGNVLGVKIEWSEEKQQAEVWKSTAEQEPLMETTNTTSSSAKSNIGSLRTFTATEAAFPVVVDGTPVKFDMPVVTIQDRVYLPLRALGNALGVDVSWNEAKHQVEVWKTAIKEEVRKTKYNYKTNDEIKKGPAEDIVESRFSSEDSLYGLNKNDNRIILGADQDNNLIFLNMVYSTDTYDIIKVEPNGNTTFLIENLTNGESSRIAYMKMEGSFITWAESNSSNSDYNCSIYYANLNTKEVILIDNKANFESTAAGAETPEYFSITSEYIAYSILEYDEQEKAKEVIKLYHIPAKKLEVIASYPVYHGGTYTASLSDDYLVWADQDYHINLYHLRTKKKITLQTDDKFQDPVISGDYICAVNDVNGDNFYMQIYIYCISENEWKYKINSDYSEYTTVEEPGLTSRKKSLYHITKSGKYVTWGVDNRGVPIIIFDTSAGTLYTVDKYFPGIYKQWIELFSGNLLGWAEAGNGGPGRSLQVFLK